MKQWEITEKEKLLNNFYIKYKVSLLDCGINKEIIKGEGPINSSLAIIGDSLEKVDVNSKRVIPSGVIKLLNFVGIKPEDAYITDILKFIPEATSAKTGKTIRRAPNKNEIELCAPFLFEEIKIIKPGITVTLGGNPLKALTGDASIKVKDFHGKELELSDLLIYPLFNPKTVIFSDEICQMYEKDLENLKVLLKRLGLGC